MSYFSATDTMALGSSSSKFFFDELPEVPMFHAISNAARWNLSLYSHYPDPPRDELLDFSDEPSRLLCSVGRVFPLPPLFVELSARSDKAGVDFQHIWLEPGIVEQSLE